MNWCWLMGHKYTVYAKPKEDWSKGVRWLRCSRCRKDFVINAQLKCLLPMDFEIMDNHEWEIVNHA